MKSRFMVSWMRVVLGLVGLIALAGFWQFAWGPQGHVMSRRSLCQYNLKQIANCLKQYTQDYDELFPPVNARHLASTTQAISGWLNSLQPYAKGVAVFQCPSEVHNELGKTDYAINVMVANGHNEIYFHYADRTVMLCEIDESDGSVASASAPLVTNRHLNGSNYSFVDGHVKWLPFSKAPVPANVPAKGHDFTFGP